METILNFILVVAAFSVLTGGWMGVQLMAKRMNVKNHIDNGGGCCGACDNRASCSKMEAMEP